MPNVPKGICAKCKKEFPMAYLHPVFLNRCYSPSVCGICALIMVDTITGIPRKSFSHGSTAERYRQQAIQWLKNKA